MLSEVAHIHLCIARLDTIVWLVDLPLTGFASPIVPCSSGEVSIREMAVDPSRTDIVQSDAARIFSPPTENRLILYVGHRSTWNKRGLVDRVTMFGY